ncbi:MAG: hypothetical protein ACHREM_33955, partial [Polyangiales bacterium]
DPQLVPTVQIQYGHLVDSAITDALDEGSTDAEKRLYLAHRPTGSDACVYPTRCVVGARRVVSGYTLNNGADGARPFELRYRNARYQGFGRGWLGFAERFTLDSATRAGTGEYRDNFTFDLKWRAFPYLGLTNTLRWSADEPGLADTTSSVELTYAFVQPQIVESVAGATFYAAPQYRNEARYQGTWPEAPGQTLIDFAEGAAGSGVPLSTTETDFSGWDNYGNATGESTSTDGVTLTHTVTRHYVNDEDAWIIGRADFIHECSDGGDPEENPTQCRITGRAYDAIGRLTGESTGTIGDASTEVALTYKYDGFGNVVETDAIDGDGHTRGSCATYEPEGVFVYARVNPAGHTTFLDFDPVLGAPAALVDANGLATRWAHDGFGRRTLERRPDGTASSTTVARKQTPDLGYYVEAETTTDGGQDETVRYDHLGREIIHWWQNAQPTCIKGACLKVPRTVQYTNYDVLGERVATRTLPTSEATPLASMRADGWAYDGAGRVIAHHSP